MLNSFVFMMFNFCINLYTVIQFHLLQFKKKHWIPFCEEYFGDNEELEEVSITYVKDGIKVGDASSISHDYDFLVYKKDIQYQIALSQGVKFTCKPCSFKFMSIEMKINERSISISLFEKDTYNYYVQGNKIDNKVLQFIINTHYSHEFKKAFDQDCLLLNDCDYTLHIIDNDVNIIQVKNDQIIVLNESSYQVIDHLSKYDVN